MAPKYNNLGSYQAYRFNSDSPIRHLTCSVLQAWHLKTIGLAANVSLLRSSGLMLDHQLTV